MSRGHEALSLLVGFVDELDRTRSSPMLRALIEGQRANYPQLSLLLDRGRVLAKEASIPLVVSNAPRDGLVWCGACEAIHLPEGAAIAAPQSTGERRTS